MARVNYNKLKEMTEALNKTELKDPIKYANVKKADLCELFCQTIEDIDDAGKSADIPVHIVDFYVKNFVDADDADKEKTPVKKKVVESDGEKRKIKTTVRMSTKIDKTYVYVSFKDGEQMKKKLPNKSEKDKLKKMVKACIVWAKNQGATVGQAAAVRKAFTANGYHITK